MPNDLECLRSLKDRDLVREGLLVAEGREVCLRLFASGCEVHAVAGTPHAIAALKDHIPAGCRVHIMSAPQLSEILGFRFHRGVLAMAPMPPPRPLGELTKSGGSVPRRLLVCPHISDPENLGSMYRSASALGWDGIITGPETVSPWSRRVVRVSMGSVFLLPWWQVANPGDLRPLRDAGYLLAGTTIAPGCRDVKAFAADLDTLEELEGRTQPLALLFGHEYHGLADPWQEVCEQFVHIPMSEGPDSLNVSVSAAICCYLLGRPARKDQSPEAAL